MNKMNQLTDMAEKLKKCSEILIEVADTLAAMLDSDNQTNGTSPKQSPDSLTLEQVRSMLAEKARNGYTAKIRELLEKHGVNKLSEVDPEKYSTLLAEAEELENG